METACSTRVCKKSWNWGYAGGGLILLIGMVLHFKNFLLLLEIEEYLLACVNTLGLCLCGIGSTWRYRFRWCINVLRVGTAICLAAFAIIIMRELVVIAVIEIIAFVLCAIGNRKRVRSIHS